MSSYSTLAESVGDARATLAATGGLYGWPAADMSAILADVDAAEEDADGWFTSDAEEAQAFWESLHRRWASWNGGLERMDKIGAWLASGHEAATEAVNEDEADDTSTIIGGGLSGTAEDLQAAGATAVTIASDKTTWYILAALAIGFGLWRIAGTGNQALRMYGASR